METGVEIGVEQALHMVSAGLDALAAHGHSFRAPTELTEVLVSTTRLRSQLDAVIATTAAEVDRFSVQKDAGYRTVEQLVADKTGADAKQTRADLRLGRWIDDFPEFAQAWADNTILTCHLEHIRRSVHNSRTRPDLIAEQSEFIDWAGDLDFVDFEHVCLYWKSAVDPDGAEPKDQTAKNYFRARQLGDGSGKLEGFLDPLMFAAFKTAFNREDQKLFRQSQENDPTSGNAMFGDADHVPEQTTGQRGAHAFMNLVVRGAARKDGSQPEPLITVVASEQVIEDTLKRVDEPSDEPLPLAFDDIDKRCELADGTPLHPSYLLAVLGVATFRRQILNAKGRTIDVSLNSRCFTPWQKQALIVEPRGRCTSPGCDAPFSWLHADHNHAHSRGGPTRLDNGKMKCGPDNLAKGDRIAA